MTCFQAVGDPQKPLHNNFTLYLGKMLQRLKRRENTQTRDAITFPEAFQFLITQADVCDYVIKMTGEYLEPFLSLQTQYKDTMKDLINW